MRAVWKGSISFGLVSIPVRLYPAISPKDVRFHEVDRTTGRRVRRRQVIREEPPFYEDDNAAEAPAGDAAEGPARAHDAPRSVAATESSNERPVARQEIVKGYEVEPGRIVQLEREEIEELRPERSKTIDIEHFVELEDIDPKYFEKSYHLAPSEELAHRPYSLLLKAMESTGRVGIGRFVLRTKEHLVAIRPTMGILGLETLYFADEVNEPLPSWLAYRDERATEKEMKLSTTLIEALAADWAPEEYEDRDRTRLMELIASRTPREIEAEDVEPAAGPAVPDLMEALRASVEAVRSEKPKRKPASRARR
jgi:DNA end-binding protein Ku